MVKFCERTDSFNWSWDQVAQVFWFRYPNPYSQHVQTEDVLSRQVVDGKLFTKRLLTKTVRIPCFGRKLTIKNEPIVEESIIDPVSQSITTYTRNIGVKAAVIEEKCIYKLSGEQQTSVERLAWISSSRMYISRAIEAYMVRKFRTTINRTCLGLQHVLNSMYPMVVHQESKSLSLMENTEKLREKAKQAKEMAKARAVPLLASCSASSH